MRLQRLQRYPAISAPRNDHSNTSQGVSKIKICDGEFISKVLDRRWTLISPDSKINQVKLSTLRTRNGDGPFGNIFFSNNSHPSLCDDVMSVNDQDPFFYVVRDDLLHPLINGNKARKLDALLPLIEDHLVTDVVTCGGCQSAHAAAVAVSCAQRGLKSHLLLRGEQPEILTGYNLVSTIYGNVTYVPRSLYAKREEMLWRHADLVAGSSGSVVWSSEVLEASVSTQMNHNLNFEGLASHRSAGNLPRKVIIINEGAGDIAALFGVIRLVQYLSQSHLLGKERALKLVVDAGTGTTAVGLGLGAICLGLPWEVTAVMLADSVDGYRKQETRLISDFKRCSGLHLPDYVLNGVDTDIVHWEERNRPRKFGNVLKGEVEECQQIAQETGIMVDPVYTLAAWELAMQLCQKEAKDGAKVVMLHTGGTLGMFGLAQRFRNYLSDFATVP